MAELLAELYVKIGSDFIKVDSDLAKLHSRIKGVAPSISELETGFNKITKAAGVMGGIVGTIGIAKFGKDVFESSLKMENLNKMILANEGSQTKANTAMARYLEMAKLPGLNLTQITQASTQFKSLGLAVEQSDRTIKALANTLVLAGRGTEEFGRVNVQFQQMLGKGRLMAEDLRVIAESMPQIRGLMTKAFGTSDTDALAKSGVNASEFIAKITAEMEKLPKAIGGTQNSIDNFRDSLLQFESALGKNVLPQIGKLLDKLTSMMDTFNKLPESTKSAIGTLAIAGGGILGIAFAVNTLSKALGVLGMSSGLKSLMGIGANVGAVSVGGALAGAGGTELVKKWVPNAAGSLSAPGYATGSYQSVASGAVAGGVAGGAIKALGMTIPQLVVGTIIASAIMYKGAELLGKLAGGKPATFIPSEYQMMKSGMDTAEGANIRNIPAVQEELKRRKEIMPKLQQVQLDAGNFPDMTFKEMVKAKATTTENMQVWFGALGKSFEDWQNKTFVDLKNSMTLPGKMYKTEVGPPEPISTKPKLTGTIPEQYSQWTDISGEGYYSTIDEKIAKLKELREVNKLEPATLREVNNTITDLLKDKKELDKKSFDEWQSILKDGYAEGLAIVTKGNEDIAGQLGMQKTPITIEGALGFEYQLPENVKRIPPVPEKRPNIPSADLGIGEYGPSINEMRGIKDTSYDAEYMSRLGESAKKYTEEQVKEQERLIKLDSDMIDLSIQLAEKDQINIDRIKERTSALKNAISPIEAYTQALKEMYDLSDQDIADLKSRMEITPVIGDLNPDFYIQTLDNIQKNTKDKLNLEAKLSIDDQSLEAEIKRIERKYKTIYLEAERLGIPKTMVEQAKAEEIKTSKPYQEKWGISDSESKALDKRVDQYNEIMYGIEKADKKQSAFWDNAIQGVNDFAMASSDKFMGDQFDRWFKKGDIKEAYKDYEKQFALTQKQAERAGQTFDDTKTSFQEFTDDWNAQLDIQRETWKDFLKDFLKDFATMLAKKLAMFAAEKATEWAIEKGTQFLANKFGKQEIPGGVTSDASTSRKGDTPTLSEGIQKGSTAMGLSKIPGVGLPLAVGYGMYEGGKMAGKYAPTTSEQRKGHTWLSKAIEGYTNVMQFPLKWGLRAGSKEWRESQGLEHYAKGGIIDKPTIALVGEAGREFVIPESKIKQSTGMSSTEIEKNISNILNNTNSISNIKNISNVESKPMPDYFFAQGGSGIVTKPTTIMMGERGPESFNIQPLNNIQSKQLSNSGTTHIEIHNINVPDTWDRAKAENVVVDAFNDAVRHGRL